MFEFTPGLFLGWGFYLIIIKRFYDFIEFYLNFLILLAGIVFSITFDINNENDNGINNKIHNT